MVVFQPLTHYSWEFEVVGIPMVILVQPSCHPVVFINAFCIRYLLLHAKFPQNLISLTQLIFIFSQFLWVRNPGAVYLGASGSKYFMKLPEDIGQGWSHLKAPLGEDSLPSSCTWLSLKIQIHFLQGYRVPIPHCLFTGSLSRFLATWVSPQVSSQHGNEFPSEGVIKREQKSTRWSYNLFVT